MIRLSYFIRKHPDLSPEDFQERLFERYALTVGQRAPALRIRRHVQALTLHQDPVGAMLQQLYGTGGEPFDGVIEFWWKSRGDLEEALATPEGAQAAAALVESERGFVDFARSALWFAVDMPQINPPGVVVAREDTAILKAYYLGPVHPHLSSEKAKFHWFTCHGPLARQYEQFLPFLRYIQVHAIEDPIAAGFRAARDAMAAPAYIGHAEVWADRRDLALATGPEAQAAFGLLARDIAAFVDTTEATVFVAKEQVVVDRPIMSPPLPTP